jgi:hypothetical protein
MPARVCDAFTIVKLEVSLNVLLTEVPEAHVENCYDLCSYLSDLKAMSAVKKVNLTIS